MQNKKPNSEINQVDTIDRYSPYVQESFDLNRMDNFVTGLGVEYLHYKSMPSPIGLKDRGDYRREDGVDTITSNGMIYKCVGKFTATMTDNSRDRKRGEAGVLDPSESLLVLPRFYNKNGIADGDRIYLSPGDRIYIANKNIDVLVSNQQKIDYEVTSDDVPMFPIHTMELPIVDSKNIEYVENIDYCITKDGNIHWISGAKNPGIDPSTGKGRIYSVRYLYLAYWYITKLIKEVRITNVSVDGIRAPERASYHAMAQREYVYHNQNRGSQINQLKPKDANRTIQAPIEPINPSEYEVAVDMEAIGNYDDKSKNNE